MECVTSGSIGSVGLSPQLDLENGEVTNPLGFSSAPGTEITAEATEGNVVLPLFAEVNRSQTPAGGEMHPITFSEELKLPE